MHSQVDAGRCPNRATLSTYVSGSLAEDRAVRVQAHLETCQSCQQRADQLAGNADSLINALRRSSGASQPDKTQLDELISAAAELETQAAVAGKTTPPRDGTVKLQRFVACLKKSGLFDADEVDRLVAQIDPPDTKSFCRELVQRHRLTPFQAKALRQGRYRGLILGNYVVLEKLGEGGMGRVFKARHRRMGRTVCIKVLNSDGRKSPLQVERFRREAQTVAALKHPGIVVAHDADEADGIPYLVMEYIEGKDLAHRVADDGPLPVYEACRILLQAAEALDYAHRQGVVHRDIKPHNLLVTPGGKLKILDMGLARFDSYLNDNPDASTHFAMTAAGVVMGTVDYMSPEQALNSRHADNRSDIYSLGCTFYYLLTGRPVFEGETVIERLIAHRERNAPALEEAAGQLPRGVSAVFQLMTAKDPQQRYQTMADVADDFRTLLDGDVPRAVESVEEPIVIDLPLLGTPRRRPGETHPLLARTFAGITLLLVLAFAGWLAHATGWWQELGGPDLSGAIQSNCPQSEQDN